VTGTRPPGRLAYLAMLGVTAAGTLGGTVINAPLDWIREEFHSTDARVVLAVAAYTVAMAVSVPLAGWLCDRFGAIRVVLAGLALLALAQLLAVFAPSLEMLIVLRAVQGAACAAFPPGVQRSLVILWPEKGSAALAAWAAAIGVGQAMGPPLGGLITQAVGWRGVFCFSAAFSGLLFAVVVLTVPRTAGRRVPLHAPGMGFLMAAVGFAIATVTLVGQRGPWPVELLVGAAAVVCGVVFMVLASRHPDELVPPRLLMEARYMRATAIAMSAMVVTGITLSSLPLWLAQVLGLEPGFVGLVVFTTAAAMALAAPLTSVLQKRLGGWLAVVSALSALLAVTLALGAWLDWGPVGTHTVAEAAGRAAAQAGAGAVSVGGAVPAPVVQALVIVVLLAVLGAALNASQGLAAFSVSQTAGGRNPLAFGLHNTGRFAGLAVGFAWTALTYPLGSMLLVGSGAAVAVAVSLLLVLRGGPLPAQE
jgi:MFS family permease